MIILLKYKPCSVLVHIVDTMIILFSLGDNSAKQMLLQLHIIVNPVIYIRLALVANRQHNPLGISLASDSAYASERHSNGVRQVSYISQRGAVLLLLFDDHLQPAVQIYCRWRGSDSTTTCSTFTSCVAYITPPNIGGRDTVLPSRPPSFPYTI